MKSYFGLSLLALLTFYSGLVNASSVVSSTVSTDIIVGKTALAAVNWEWSSAKNLPTTLSPGTELGRLKLSANAEGNAIEIKEAGSSHSGNDFIWTNDSTSASGGQIAAQAWFQDKILSRDNGVITLRNIKDSQITVIFRNIEATNLAPGRYKDNFTVSLYSL